MSDESQSESNRPTRSGSSWTWLIPLVTVIAVAAAVIAGLLIEASPDEPQRAPEPPSELPSGQELYERHCAVCHGDDGQSTSARYPPLVDTRWVVGDKRRLILVTLHGLRGPIEVRDRTYDELMPGFGTRLSNAEIAELLTYIRTSWGNDATDIDTADVADIRQEHRLDRGPWTADELDALDEL